MKVRRPLELLFSLLIFILETTVHVLAGTKFASHVSVNTPARSFTHGVGDPLPETAFGRRIYPHRGNFRSLRRPSVRPQAQRNVGYPRVKPTIPFNHEDVSHDNGLNVLPWQYNNHMESAIPVLPPSPYKIDSPDPESLWPEGLFLPPIQPSRFNPIGRRRSDTESDVVDPYLIEGTEAIAAVKRGQAHGIYYFHDIPHIKSLLANQNLRVANNLKPHRIASIRHTWPYNRP